jgi:chlorobactene glucosyltransferase
MDADTYAEPQLISRTLSYAIANKIDMLTLQPWYEMRGLWERIVLPAALAPLFVLFPPHRVNNPKDKMAIANGQFILIRKDVYDAIEGHAGVRRQMMDDFSLALNVKRAGYRLSIVDGSQVMRVRLYTNLREIRDGALKASVEITGGWFSSLIGMILNIAINILPLILLLASLLAGNSTNVLLLGAVVALQVLYYSAVRVAAFRAPPWSSITYPIGGIIITLILMDGMIRLITGREIKWKGRDLLGRPEISVRPTKRTE